MSLLYRAASRDSIADWITFMCYDNEFRSSYNICCIYWTFLKHCFERLAGKLMSLMQSTWMLDSEMSWESQASMYLKAKIFWRGSVVSREWLIGCPLSSSDSDDGKERTPLSEIWTASKVQWNKTNNLNFQTLLVLKLK